MLRWLNEIPCRDSLVCSMVLEFYLHVTWIVVFIFATREHIEDDGRVGGVPTWQPISLLLLAALFFLQEVYQLYRYAKTHVAIAYWLDMWNWIDITTISLVAASAVQFLQRDMSVQNDNLLITAGLFQCLLILSYLKKTFFPFSKFVSGIIKVSHVQM